MKIAVESGHYYTKDGEPCYTVPNKTRGGVRPTTLRDARKLDLVPSVTGILNVIAKPGLERWKHEQLLLAALTLPAIEGESVDDFARRVEQDSKEQAKVARETGTAIHGSLELAFQGKPFPLDHEFAVLEVKSALDSLFGQQTWSAERSFAHSLGYGGKVDLWSPGCVVDYKVKEKLVKKMAYDEHAMQLCAYREGLGIPNARIANVFVSWEGEVQIHEWDDETENERYWGMFCDLLAYWQKFKRYWPQLGGSESATQSVTKLHLTTED